MNKPKIYIAAPTPWKNQAAVLQEEIALRYPKTFDFISDWYRIQDTFSSETALKDFYQIVDSDIFILIADVWRLSEGGGSEVEFGVAMANCAKTRRILVVGKIYNIFQLLPWVEKYNTKEEVIDALEESS